MKEKLTFYQTLTSPTPDIPPPGATPERKVVEERMVVKGAEQRSAVEGVGPGEDGSGASQRAWTIQVSSFRNRTRAEEQIKQLAKKGYDAYLSVAQSEDGPARYRVRVGRFATQVEAERVAERIAAELKVGPVITRRS